MLLISKRNLRTNTLGIKRSYITIGYIQWTFETKIKRDYVVDTYNLKLKTGDVSHIYNIT